ncbi:MAG: hypothetical protein QME05_05565 [Candidatus Margulisbacteria bacterium]|nr:hypothetical protein [Candidatus Margulisiibacteriota bacterium]
MLDSLILNKKSIESIYKTICEYHGKYLRKFGVKLPKLYNLHGKFTKDALVLVYLAYDYPNTRKVSKGELTKFVRSYYPNTNDVQQARHLGAQAGWWIVAGGRDNIVYRIERGSYQLYTLEQPYPGFKKGHRITGTENWGKIKEKYNYRCATCGSQEGRPHFHWPATKTILQKAHMDPHKPLIAGNRWVYDEKGRVIKIANPTAIKNCDKKIRKSIYRILCREFHSKRIDLR